MNKVDPFQRGYLLACLLRDGVSLTTAFIRQKFGVSVATAKRDKTAALRLADQIKRQADARSGVIAGPRQVPSWRYDATGRVPYE